MMRSALFAVILSSSVEAQTLPDPRLTPGRADASIALSAVCETKWGKTQRHVTASMRREVFLRYRMSGPHDARCQHKGCEVDHLISRELGGTDDVANLWPQPYSGPWNAKMKDRLENRLRREVCHGGLSLQDAQRGIASDWTALYRRFFVGR